MNTEDILHVGAGQLSGLSGHVFDLSYSVQAHFPERSDQS